MSPTPAPPAPKSKALAGRILLRRPGGFAGGLPFGLSIALYRLEDDGRTLREVVISGQHQARTNEVAFWYA